jgi:hypothetical protein
MKKGLLYYLGGLTVTFIGILAYNKFKNKKITIDTKTTSNNFWEKVLYGVISVEYGFNTPCNNNTGKGCRGKRYTDVLELDSGTIGIAHFASGGLKKVYEAMDTEKYFGRSERDMINNYSHRKSYASNNQWWIDGFTRWVNDRKNDKVQDDLFRQSRQDAIDDAKKNGWKTDREFAIAVGVSNSFGNAGFRKNASLNDWNAEKVLQWYRSGSSHRNKRAVQIDKWFPKSKEKKIKL